MLTTMGGADPRVVVGLVPDAGDSDSPDSNALCWELVMSPAASALPANHPRQT